MSEFLERIAKLPPKRVALLAAELQARLERAESAHTAPIAVIGMACRFPGGADDPARFWRLLQDGVDAITTVPADRFDIEALYDPRPEAVGKLSTRHGGFLTDVDRFDAALFGIAPREAQSMDPQQRLVLETAWEALEDAGHAPDRLAGSRTGVFVGICNFDYYQMVMRQDAAALDVYVATGGAHSVAAGRVAYVLGLAGPSLAVDTSCSSSLTAVHLACRSLRSGESRMALAAGVNVILLPDTGVLLSRARMMAPDGRCKAFDAAADGFVRGEGCGVLVLKRLDLALADGDRILAVVRGSAMNQDGRSNGLTAPSGPAQEAVIREALASAGLTPGDVGYVEAHGTGTSLGDPIEVRALGAVFGPGRPAGRPLMIGSVKTNIGHLESAAGSAGMIKVVLALRHAEIPPHLHLKEPSPHIAWEQLPLTVPTERTAWEPLNGRRVAGVSSFGFSGTNVHVVMEGAPAPAPLEPGPERPRHLLPLSARHEDTLREAAARLTGYLHEHPELELADVCFTAGVGRAQLANRVALPVSSLAEARAALDAVARGETPETAVAGRVGAAAPEPVFLFTGQGAQRVGVARELYDSQPVFREALERCDAVLRGHLDRPLLSVLYPAPGEASPLDDTAYAQPALFAIEWALAELWRAWGVTPAAVLGHSVGEYVAACVAGMCSLEEGLALIAERGRLMQALPREGAMVAFFAGEAVVGAALRGREADLAIAAVNGPEHTVVSGRADAVAAVTSELQARGVRSQRLNVSHAFHSPLLQPVLEPLERLAGRVSWARPRIGVVSNLTGAFATDGELASGAYWRRHAREPVRFADGVRTLAGAGSTVFIEIGPAPTLLGMAARCLPGDVHIWLPSLRPGRSDWETILSALATLWVRGVSVDWAGFERGYRRRRVELPTSPFRRERYWVEAAAESRGRSLGQGRSVHPLLGERLRSALDVAQFESVLGPRGLPWLGEHRLHGGARAPASVFVEMLLAASTQLGGSAPGAIEDLRLLAPLEFHDDAAHVVQVLAAPADGGGAAITIASLGGEGAAPGRWRRHATGRTIPRAVGAIAPPGESIDAIRARCVDAWSGERLYARLESQGIELGPSFRGVVRLQRRDGEALAEIDLPAAAGDASSYWLHPALVDAAFQAIGAAWPQGREGSYVLSAVRRFEVWDPTASPALAHAALRPITVDSPEAVAGDLTLLDPDGRVLARADGLELRRVTAAMPAAAQDWCYEVTWDSKPLAPAPVAAALAGPAAIAARIGPEVEALAATHRLDAHDASLDALDVVATEHVVRALHELGWDPRPGAHVRTDALAAELGVVPVHQRLFGRLLEMLAADGVLAAGEGRDAWIVRRPPVAAAAGAARAQAVTTASAELALLERCGARLAAVLRGGVDPLQLLFPQGELDSVERIYEGGPAARAFNALVRRAVETAVAALPATRGLRVLEIGAGTGATTAALLPALAPVTTEYVFTDLSPLFLARAGERFHDTPFLTCRSLDIEGDPEAQGFTAGTFDLVVAANVLHATQDLRRTLRHVRRLLAPEGLLVLLEGTTAYRWVDLTFGLTEGWWRFRDADLRPSYPLLPPGAWRDLLETEGFVDPRTVPDTASVRRALSSQSVILARAPSASASIEWVVLADRHGVGDRVAALLRGRGERCLVVSAGTADDASADGWVLRPERPEGFRRLVEAVLGAGERGTTVRILHLWSLDSDAGSRQSLEAAETLGPGSLLHLAQALAGSPAAGRARLWVVTRGAQPATQAQAPLEEAQAMVWGFGRALALEHAEFWGGLVDLDSDSLDPASALLTELASTDGEDQVALRGDRRLVARLRRRAPLSGAVPELRAAATYLVTGGLGGLGLKVGQWLARRGARHLVLLGLRGIEAGGMERERRQAGIRAIEELGASVHVAACDVGDEQALGALLDDMRASMPPLRGIVHAAAAIEATPVRELDLPGLRRVLRPKVMGTWLLDRATRDAELDFFALFSSTTALLGATGFAHYAAGNQFLDAVAHARRARGAPAVSVNWGIWDEMRMASEDDRRRLVDTGLRPMASDAALDLLGIALGGDIVQPVVAAIDWGVLTPLYEARRRQPFLAEVAVVARRAPRTVAGPDLRRRLQSAPPEAHRDVVLQWVREEIAAVLRLPAAEVDAGRGLFDMGLDSLMALDLRGRLEAGVGRPLPSTLAFNYPTANALAEFLAGDGATPAEAAGPAPAPRAEGGGDDRDTDDLSEDELAALLARKLERLR
jgi:acyl transferase domain-containing protein/acyl carrier protein